MALTPDGKSLLVGDTAGNSLFYLDPQSGAVQRRITVSDPYQLVFSPDGRFLAIAGLARNQIDIYDAATMRLEHRIPAPAMPSHINYSPDSSLVFVSLQETDSLIAIETATGKVLWKTKVGKTPAGVLWHHGKLLVGIMGSDCVAVVDPVDGHVERCVRTGRGAHVMFVPARPEGDLRLQPGGRHDLGAGSEHSRGGADLEGSGRTGRHGFRPGRQDLASLRWNQRVAVLDPVTGNVQTILVGRSPHGIWLNTHMQPLLPAASPRS